MSSADYVYDSARQSYWLPSRRGGPNPQPDQAEGRSDGNPAEPLLQDCVQVGGPVRAIWFVAPALVAVAFAVASIALWPVAQAASLIALAGMCLCLSTLLVALWNVPRRRYWVGLCNDGFIVVGENGTRRVFDDEVAALWIRRRPRRAVGELKWVTRSVHLELKSSGESRRLVFRDRLQASQADPLQTWIARVQTVLYDRCAESIGRQAPVAGEGWAIERGDLRIGTRPKEQTISLDDVAAIDVVDRELCIWTCESTRPTMRLPMDGRDVWLLERILRERLPERTAVESHEADSGLGRILFERGQSRAGKITWYVLAVVCFVAGAALLATPVPVAGLCAWAICLISGVTGFHFSRYVFRVHENGVTKASPFRVRSLRDEEVGSVTYWTCKLYANSIYYGTQYTFSLSPRDQVAKGITYAAVLSSPDDELLRLRDRISYRISMRLLDDFIAGLPILWTRRLHLLPNGIAYHPKSWLGRRKTVFVPYDSITVFGVMSDRFCVWTNYQERAVLSEHTREPNFYAGLALLQELAAGDPELFPALR